MKKILILGGVGAPKEAFRNAAEKYGMTCEFAAIQSLQCVITDEGVAWSLRDTSIEGIEIVIIRGIHSGQETRNTIAQFALVKDFCRYLLLAGVQVFDEGVLEYDTLNKYEMTKRMAQAGLPTIPTRFILSVNEKKHLTFPCVIKPVIGSRGNGIYKLETRQEFRDWHKTSAYYPAMVQPWVPNTFDLRVVVIGDEVATVIRRERTEGDINNLSQGSTGSEVEIKDELKSLAIKAAQAFKYNIAGIDLVQNAQTGEWYVLEVNRSPGFSYTNKISSVNVFDRIMAMIAEKSNSR